MKTTIFSFALLVVLGALAHPGALDANGGHTDRKTGVYHFHRGTNAPAGTATNASPVDEEPKQIKNEAGAAELQKLQSKVEPASQLAKLPWWIYLLALGVGYAVWETAWYFCQKREAKCL